ncbi:MAG: hypothetical protein AAFY02_14270 [Pseudomonadota bacterium]
MTSYKYSLTFRLFDISNTPVSEAVFEIVDPDNGEVLGSASRSDSGAYRLRFNTSEDTVLVRARYDDWSQEQQIAVDTPSFDFNIDRRINMIVNPLSKWSFALGFLLLLVLLGLSTWEPNPTPAQRQVWQVILAVAAAAFANGIEGLLEVNFNAPKLGVAIRAIGAIGVAVIVYFFVPAFA